MGRKPTGRTPISSFRLTARELADMDAVAVRLAAATGGEPNRTDAIRYGVRLALTGTVPLVGDLGAGRPRTEPGEPAEHLLVSGLFPAGVVAYRVRGRSMEGDLIGDGDYVVVRPAPDADHGTIVVAWLKGLGAVLKRYDKAKGVLFSGTGRHRWTHTLTADDWIGGVFVGLIRKT